MKVLITGGTGFIGRHLVDLLKHSAHAVTVVARTIDYHLFPANVGCIEANICNPEDIQAAIIFTAPDLVIHSAAMSKPNDCEMQRALCYAVNVQGTQNIIDGCKAIGAKLIFMSTDFVFGHKGPYREADEYCPVNYYGASKIMAEKLVVASGLFYAIVRTVMVLGKKLPGQNNTFLHWVKDNLDQQKAIRVFTDQYRSVTYVNDLCRGIESIIERGFQGVVHLCGSTIYTPFSLAQELAGFFSLNKNLVNPVTRETFPEAAMRPENSVLVIAKAMQELGYTTTPLQEMLPQIFG
ncbi:MAG: NAD(P)-dependent oxidoreductase [Chitinophagaceae bacterium]